MQEYLGKVVPPVLHSLVDQDARVRYYACEALYNIAKVARDDFMPHFPDTFDALFRLCADIDSAVHQATTFLDNLMKVWLPLPQIVPAKFQRTTCRMCITDKPWHAWAVIKESDSSSLP